MHGRAGVRVRGLHDGRRSDPRTRIPPGCGAHSASLAVSRPSFALVIVSLAAPVTAIAAQARHSIVTLRTVPAMPVRGTVALVVVRAVDSASRVTSVDGEAAGEPLHFEYVR